MDRFRMGDDPLGTNDTHLWLGRDTAKWLAVPSPTAGQLLTLNSADVIASSRSMPPQGILDELFLAAG